MSTVLAAPLFMLPKYDIVTVRSRSTGQVLSLFFNDHEFEFLQGYWRITRSLILRPVKLIEVHASWPGYQS
jgi:hypothetical protein